MKSTRSSACFCRRSAAWRAITACTARTLVRSITATDAAVTSSMRLCRRCNSR
jgi:hypothetical protein